MSSTPTSSNRVLYRTLSPNSLAPYGREEPSDVAEAMGLCSNELRSYNYELVKDDTVTEHNSNGAHAKVVIAIIAFLGFGCLHYLCFGAATDMQTPVISSSFMESEVVESEVVSNLDSTVECFTWLRSICNVFLRLLPLASPEFVGLTSSLDFIAAHNNTSPAHTPVEAAAEMTVSSPVAELTPNSGTDIDFNIKVSTIKGHVDERDYDTGHARVTVEYDSGKLERWYNMYNLCHVSDFPGPVKSGSSPLKFFFHYWAKGDFAEYFDEKNRTLKLCQIIDMTSTTIKIATDDDQINLCYGDDVDLNLMLSETSSSPTKEADVMKFKEKMIRQELQRQENTFEAQVQQDLQKITDLYNAGETEDMKIQITALVGNRSCEQSVKCLEQITEVFQQWRSDTADEDLRTFLNEKVTELDDALAMLTRKHKPQKATPSSRPKAFSRRGGPAAPAMPSIGE